MVVWPEGLVLRFLRLLQLVWSCVGRLWPFHLVWRLRLVCLFFTLVMFCFAFHLVFESRC